jgi:hypothetical protein
MLKPTAAQNATVVPEGNLPGPCGAPSLGFADLEQKQLQPPRTEIISPLQAYRVPGDAHSETDFFRHHRASATL